MSSYLNILLLREAVLWRDIREAYEKRIVSAALDKWVNDRLLE
jgi:hypothetical protein